MGYFYFCKMLKWAWEPALAKIGWGEHFLGCKKLKGENILKLKRRKVKGRKGTVGYSQLPFLKIKRGRGVVSTPTTKNKNKTQEK